jgi:hypothetical protein
MWRDLAQRSLDAHLADAVSQHDVELAESELGIRLPLELAEFLLESDGIVAVNGVNLVWPLRRIVDDNLAFRANEDFRELYMPFDPLLFFGEAGSGDQFAYVVLAGEVRAPDIYAWDHENDSRYWVASGLRQFIERCVDGSIRL